MIKVYDSDYNFLVLMADGLRNIYTTETLETGLKTLCFQVPCEEQYLQYIQEENYIETADYVYVIKELVLNDNDFFTVYCNANIEEISGFIFHTFDVLEQNPEQAYNYCLAQLPGWNVEYNSQDKTALTIQVADVSALEMIREIQQQTNQEVWFDTKNKILKVYNKMGSSIVRSYYANDIHLHRLAKQSSTYDYATVLYPYGKDGLTISLINNNKPYLENYSYTKKRIEKVWRNEDIDVAERLMGAAQDYLESIAKPITSYKVSLSELSDKTMLGDTIVVADTIKKIKNQHRVVKIIRYPLAPEKDNIELSNRQSDFARTFIKQKRITDKEIKYIKNVLKNISARLDEQP